MRPQEIKIEDYSYDLPDDKIPKYPLDQRDQSKLLVYKNGEISDHIFTEIKNYLPAETLLIFNDSKVLPVRFYFHNSNGARIEVFCLDAISENANSATWRCFVGKAYKWKEKTLTQKVKDASVSLTLLSKENDYYIVQFSWNEHLDSMLDVFETFGQIPIPPYLNRKSEDIDTIRYQNIFARHNGSVAAPTAGLHFTDKLISQLKAEGIQTDFVTLHVGAGTFKPVKSETIGHHPMHMERMMVSKDFIINLYANLQAGKQIGAVGTTTLRTLESLYWIGNKITKQPNLPIQELEISQWEAYNNEETISSIKSLASILEWMNRNELTTLIFSTQILIVPSYKFRLIDCLITNFHQPQSTLLLLIAAAIGNNWRSLYNHAILSNYRFLSYGDSSILYIPDDNKKKG